VLATAGKIADWELVPNGFIKKDEGELAHAIYSIGDPSRQMSVATYGPDGELVGSKTPENVLVQFGRKQ
jgi:hypothetical protein